MGSKPGLLFWSSPGNVGLFAQATWTLVSIHSFSPLFSKAGGKGATLHTFLDELEAIGEVALVRDEEQAAVSFGLPIEGFLPGYLGAKGYSASNDTAGLITSLIVATRVGFADMCRQWATHLGRLVSVVAKIERVVATWISTESGIIVIVRCYGEGCSWVV